MAGDLFRRNRPFHLLDGFYNEWSEHLTKNCLPHFRQPQPSAANNATVLRDLTSYYDTIDHYANKETIFHFLFPSWHINSLETSILFLGDVHPRLFTSLIQSFVDGHLAAWKDLTLPMNHYLYEIRQDIDENVFRLQREMREAQESFIQRFSDNWVRRGRRSVTVVETAGSVTLDETFVRIFSEANQLRKNTIANVVTVSDVNQGALFLEGVCVFLAGFRHQLAHVPAQFLPNQKFPPPYQQMMQQQQQPYAPYQQMMQPYAPYQQMMPQQQQPYGPFGAQLRPRNYNAPPMTQHQPERFHEICVENLDPDVTRDMLRHSFSRYPSVREVKIQNVTGRDEKHGSVSFADASEQRRAMQEMNGVKLLNRPMQIRRADHSRI